MGASSSSTPVSCSIPFVYLLLASRIESIVKLIFSIVYLDHLRVDHTVSESNIILKDIEVERATGYQP